MGECLYHYRVRVNFVCDGGVCTPGPGGNAIKLE